MKDSTFKHLLDFISLTSYISTLALTIYTASNIIGTKTWYWGLIAVTAAISLNTGEILMWLKFIKCKMLFEYNKIDKIPIHTWLIALTCAIVSIAATVVGMQIAVKYGEEISKVNAHKLQNAEKQNAIIDGYNKNANESRYQAGSKRNLSDHYLTKSDKFLKDAERVLAQKDTILSEIQKSTEATLSLKMYEVYTKLFGGSNTFWAFVFAIGFGIILEAVTLAVNSESYKLKNSGTLEKKSASKSKSKKNNMTTTEQKIMYAMQKYADENNNLPRGWQTQMAKDFGISKSAVSKVKNKIGFQINDN